MIALLALMACGDKEGKTITNTVEGPKRCCRQVSQEYTTAFEVGYTNFYWNGDQLDSSVSGNNKTQNKSVYFYSYTSARTREARGYSIYDGKKVFTDGYAVQNVDECGNVVSYISYDKDGKEIIRATNVFKCE